MGIFNFRFKKFIQGAYVNGRKNQGGFTLVELIVVVAIMTLLGWMIVPLWGRYVDKNKQTVCRHNRESILKIYERCVYDTSIEVSTQGDSAIADLNKIITGTDPITQGEVEQYKYCPRAKDSLDHYTGDIRTNGNNTIVASIACDICGEEVSITLDFWLSGNHGTGVDMNITPLPDVSRAPGEVSPTPIPSLPPSITKAPEVDSWPYAYDENWWDPDSFNPPNPDLVESKDLEGGDPYIKLKAPQFIIDRANKQEFLYVDSEDADQKIKQSEADSPTNFSSKHPNWLIPIGVELNPYDYELHSIGNIINIAPPSNGDIVVFSKNGELYKYVYYCKYSYLELAEMGYDVFTIFAFDWDLITEGEEDPCPDKDNDDVIRVLYLYNR